MSNSKFLVIIGGPTASGKTNVAIQLAQHFNTDIISADSRQFYHEMSIGTAKPTKRELATVPHHFVDCISVHDNFTVGDFEREALELLEELYKNRDIIIVAGGSGLYIRALCEGLDHFPEVPAQIREDLNADFQAKGIQFLQDKLQSLDPDYYSMVDLYNPQRLIRALEVCIASGRPYSSFRKNSKAERPFKTCYIQLQWDREELYERINHRVDLMMEAGLLEEAKELYSLKHLNALQTVGYQELFDFFDDKISLEEALRLIKRNSRRYAKRQLTWLRKDDFWTPFRPDQLEAMITHVQNFMDQG